MNNMKKRKLLIGTTNKDKFREISSFLDTLPFELVSLNDLKEKIAEPEENGATIEDNALLKARYYADKTGLLALADDTGFFVDALNSWPGVKSARFAPTKEERRKIVLDKMKDVPDKNRGAEFKTAIALCDPLNDSVFLAIGRDRGSVTFKPIKNNGGFGYDPIFFCGELGKTFAEATTQEKNSVSHRGRALAKIKYHLQNTYSGRHIVVPFGIIIKNSKLLLLLRNDPHRPQFHKKWEFPGGSVEYGETLEDNLLREIEEEVGYKVKVIKQLQCISVRFYEEITYKYQVYLVPFVCLIVSGEGKTSDMEVLRTEWVELDKVSDYDLMDNDPAMYKKILPELKQVVKEEKL